MFGWLRGKRRTTFERVVNRAHRDGATLVSPPPPPPDDQPYLLGIWDDMTPEQRRAFLTGEAPPPIPPPREEIGDGVERIAVPGGWIYFKKGSETPVFVPATAAKAPSGW